MRRNARRPVAGRDLRRTAARVLQSAWADRLRTYFFMHAHHLVASLGRLQRAPIASVLTVLVIAIALALPAGFQVAVKNLSRIGDSLEATNQMSVYLKPDLANAVGRKIAERLAAHPQIAEARLITKEAGLAQFQDYSGFGQALEALDFNPLPAVISIRPKDSLTRPDDVEKLLAELKELPEADFVQLDTDWMRKLHAMLSIARRSGVMLALMLSLAVLFIVGNTIRLELQNRQDEIAVTQLMGATDRFIRRPFLYTGLWYGLLGGLLAWILVSILFLLIADPVHELSSLYGGQFEPSFLSLRETFALILFATGLGCAGAWAVVDYHLWRLRQG